MITDTLITAMWDMNGKVISERIENITSKRGVNGVN